MNIVKRTWLRLKAFTMSFSRTASWGLGWLGSTHLDYRAEAGDGRTNAAVFACIRWAQRTLPEAPLTVKTRSGKDDWAEAPEHALYALLERPNAFYSGLHMIGAVVADLMLTGNAYLIKIRSGQRRVVELWWVPASMMEPAWPDDGSAFITHYEYKVEGNVTDLPISEVIHIRQGFDPSNIRKGMSDLAALYREIATDNEGANWTASLLRNGAVPGVVISPEGDGAGATPDEVDEVKTTFMQRFGGDQRGAPMVMKGPTKVSVLSFSPEDMNLRDLRIVPEERITAVLGIPAIVVGLGAGLQRSTFANFAEAREAAYESFVIPLQRLLISELQTQLVPDFGDRTRLRIEFDLSHVRVLQDDQNALHERARADLLAGGITLNQFLDAIGEEPLTGPEGDVRYIPNTVTITETTKLLEVPEPAALPAQSQDDDDEQPAPRQLAAAGMRNGHAKAAATVDATGFGPALVLSEDDIDRLSRVGPADLGPSEEFWRKAVDGSGLEDLIDAEPSGDDE
jgi:HK97 family phage portal protein